MIPPAGWQRGSFRGVPFFTEDHDEQGGRRGVLHEFPQAELPVWEDLGRAAGRFQINCHIVGDRYPADADALRVALSAPGPGTLIHPWYGSMQVAVENYSRRDSAIEGGQALFAISFLETGLPAVPAPADDTSAQAAAAANDAAAVAEEQLDEDWSIEQVTDFVDKAARDLTDALALAAQARAAIAGGPGAILALVDANADLLGLPDTLRDGLKLGQSINRLVQTVATIAPSAERSLAAIEPLMAWGGDLDPVIGATPPREQERRNQAAIVQAVNLAAAAEAVRQIARIRFASYPDAVAVRDRVVERLDLLAVRQADRGDDAGSMAYDALRQAMVRDVTARGGSLARLKSITPGTTEPAIVIANRLYGAAGVGDRADEIVTRNAVRHPNFVTGGAALEVLTSG
ncbi:DNA circularization protein [Sphingomonas sp. CJ99]